MSRGKRMSEAEFDSIKYYIAEHPRATLRKLEKVFGRSENTIVRIKQAVDFEAYQGKKRLEHTPIVETGFVPNVLVKVWKIDSGKEAILESVPNSKAYMVRWPGKKTFKNYKSLTDVFKDYTDIPQDPLSRAIEKLKLLSPRSLTDRQNLVEVLDYLEKQRNE